ncbi:MAG: hypothetical protein EBV06_18100 [Planctomycetia bacterium]|nr:hypothetical protein [Planctomycetia bacterium]
MACHSVLAAPRAARLPNIVVVFCDDLGWGDLGCQGAQGIRTPHLDRMAREGTRFTRFYVAQAVCSASRTALLTGCYPNRVGIHGALGPKQPIGLHPDETTLAEVWFDGVNKLAYLSDSSRMDFPPNWYTTDR